VARPQDSDCDTGAYESRGFNLTLTGGSPQTTLVNTAFANPLALIVSSAFNEPVQDGQVVFSAPASGAGLTFTETLASVGSGGAVSLPVTANGTAGSYEVYADAGGNIGEFLTYSLTNQLAIYLPVVVRP